MYDILEPNLAIADWLLFAGAIATSLVSGISSFFSNKKTNETNRQINKENNEFNAEQALVSRNWQEQMYQNYESPTAQVQQRLQAGLNPLDGISSQAVGSASTASASSASPQLPFDFGSAFNINGSKSLMYGQLKSQKLQNAYQENLNEQQATDLDLKKEDLNSKRFDNALKSIELGYKDDALSAEIANVKAQSESLGWSSKKTEAEIERVELDFKMAQEAYNNGVNSYQDDHDVKVYGNVKTASETIKNMSENRRNNVQTAISSLALSLSQKFDERFMQLDYEQRKKEVEEFLDTSDMRVSLFNVQKAFAKLAVDEATRQDVLSELRYRYDKVIFEHIADASEDGNAFDAVLLNYLTQNPNSVIDIFSAVSNSLSNFKPSPVKSKK